MKVDVAVPFEFCERCPRLDIQVSSAVFDFHVVVSRKFICANEEFCRQIVKEAWDAKRAKDN